MSHGADEMVAKPVMDRPDRVGKRLLDDDSKPVKIIIGGEESVQPLGERINSVEEALINPTRAKQAAEASTRLGDSVKGLSPYGEWVQRSAEMAMGLTAVERVFNKEFREKALVEAQYIPRVRGDAQPPKKLVAIPKYNGIRIGSARLRFAMSQKLFITLGKRQRATRGRFPWRFQLHGLDEIVDFPFKWHPYWSRGMATNLLLSMCGVQSGRSGVKIKDLRQRFSPSRFRPDASVNEVISLLRGYPEKATDILLAYGFTLEEITAIIPDIPKLGIYEDLADADEYVGLDDILQSIDTSVITQLISLTAPDVLNRPEPILRQVLMTQYLSLLIDEFNMACALTPKWDELTIRLPMPYIT